MARRVLTNFRAQDFRGGENASQTREAPAVAPRPESNEVPVGTSAEIQEWVGDDKDRAQRALDAENEYSEPRKGLSKHLESMLAEEDDDE